MQKKTYHLNDRTMKYQTSAQTKLQHRYLGLPGEFRIRLPQEVVFPNLDLGRADEFYLNDEGLLFNLEEESGDITDLTLEKFSKYGIFASYRYFDGRLYLVVVCHEDPKKDFEIFEYAPSLLIKVHYYYFSQEELWKKYDNVINKVEQKQELTENEALDIAFVPKFISKEYAPAVIESLTKAFKDAKIDDYLLRIDVGVVLGGMILKHIDDVEKQKRLMRRINMRHIEKEITKLVYDEFGDELDRKDEKIEAQAQEIKIKDKELETKDKELETKDKELETKDKELETKDNEISELTKSNGEYKKKLEQLSQLGDYNCPEAKKIINNLMLL